MSLAPGQVGQSSFICLRGTRMKSHYLHWSLHIKRESQAYMTQQGSTDTQNVGHFIGYLICLLNKSINYKK